jgi:radical SAM protein with 4Fe4S-binding SPASM domain
MNPVSYWLRLLKLFTHYRKKSTQLPYLPVRLWVELTSHCNYRCIMCPNRDLKREDKGFMEFSLYKKIVDEAREFVFDINLAHRGESMLSPELIEAIEYAKKNNLYTRLHTNGSLLTEDLSLRIIRSGLDRLSFSFDGYDKDTYERIRKGGDYERTVQNILRFLTIKKQMRSRTPKTAIEVISFDQVNNKGAKDSFLRQFKNLPLDNFAMKDMHNWAGQIEKKKHGKKYTVCPFPWNALIIYWNGAVLPCTQDFFGCAVVGNVRDSTLAEIWNNEKMVHLRKMLAQGNIKELEACSDCDRVWREVFLGVPKEYLWKFITKRMP